MKQPPPSLVREVPLAFIEDGHRYLDLDNERVLTSATTLIKRYSHTFDADHHAARIAERDGVDADELKAKWSLNAELAAARGTYIHWQIEQICAEVNLKNTITVSLHPNEHLPLMQGVARFFIQNIELAQGWLLPEHRIYHPTFGLAGTIDLVASNYKGVPAIIDWKTNRTMEVEGYSNMLPPFQRGKLKLPDSNLMHYFLQLNLYRRILMDCYDFEPELMVVVHLQPGMFTEYPVPLMDAHVDKLLELCSSPQP